MKRHQFILSFVFVLLVLITLWLLWRPFGICVISYFAPTPAKIIMPAQLIIETGESPISLQARYGKAIDVNDKNFGLDFYSVDWPSDETGQVIIKNATSMLTLDTVLGVMGTFSKERPQEGIFSYAISAGIPPRNNAPHDEARLKFYELLQRIQRAGWKRWIEPYDPRLSGVDAYRFQTGDTTYSLDADTRVALNLWMSLKDRSRWRFFQNRVVMTVHMMRDEKRMNPNLPGAYFVTIDLKSQDADRRDGSATENRSNWRDFYPELRKQYARQRAEQEKKLRTQGYTIDTQYQDRDD